MASRREPMKDAIISNCLLWFCCKWISSMPCFSMDSRLFLMEIASSSLVSSVGTVLFVVGFLSFQHCLLGLARLTSASEISLLVPLVPLVAMLLSGGLGVQLVLGCEPSWSLGGFALGEDGEVVLVVENTFNYVASCVTLAPWLCVFIFVNQILDLLLAFFGCLFGAKVHFNLIADFKLNFPCILAF